MHMCFGLHMPTRSKTTEMLRLLSEIFGGLHLIFGTMGGNLHATPSGMRIWSIAVQYPLLAPSFNFPILLGFRVNVAVSNVDPRPFLL